MICFMRKFISCKISQSSVNFYKLQSAPIYAMVRTSMSIYILYIGIIYMVLNNLNLGLRMLQNDSTKKETCPTILRFIHSRNFVFINEIVSQKQYGEISVRSLTKTA